MRLSCTDRCVPLRKCVQTDRVPVAFGHVTVMLHRSSGARPRPAQADVALSAIVSWPHIDWIQFNYCTRYWNYTSMFIIRSQLQHYRTKRIIL